jgi:D-cysteine desulfhydrase family pyridoxal phosphate-dependent enzyme
MTHHPRVTLVQGPTPVEPLSRLSELYGVQLSVKRDDLAGVSFGGNKARQLEYYLGAAMAAQADTILITGAVQSNFVRTAAASAARLGMKTIVQLEDRVGGMDDQYRRSGNVLLLDLMGVEIIHYPEGEDESGADRSLRAKAAKLTKTGRKPFVIPLGLGEKPLGALGYMHAAEEVIATGTQYDAIIVPTGSGLTHAGFLCGLRNAGDQTRVIGSCVRRAADLQSARIAQVIANTEALLGRSTGVTPQDIQIWDGALAPGYGKMGPPAAQAIRDAAQHEGLILDPVYSAKAFAAIPALIERDDIEKDARVLFLHTGGLSAVFAYEAMMRQALVKPTITETPITETL